MLQIDDIKRRIENLHKSFTQTKNDGTNFLKRDLKKYKKWNWDLTLMKGKYDSNYDYFFNGQQKTSQTYLTSKNKTKMNRQNRPWKK